MSVELKVKAATLAEESRIIRRETNKLKCVALNASTTIMMAAVITVLKNKEQGTFSEIADTLSVGNSVVKRSLTKMLNCGYVEIAADEKDDGGRSAVFKLTDKGYEGFEINRADLVERRTKAMKAFNKLDLHNDRIVRRVARNTHLARTFIGGKLTYSQVEAKVKSGKQLFTSDIQAINRMVLSYSNHHKKLGSNAVAALVDQWLTQT